MGYTIKIVLLKQSKTDIEGTVYVRTTESRVSKVKSLGIKIKESEFKNYFNEEKQRFKKSDRFKNSELYNTKIIDFLRKLNKYESLTNIPDEKKSFLRYWKNRMDNIINHGSKIKHETVYGKLVKYLTSINRSDLLFKEIGPEFLGKLNFYLSHSKDPKSLSENTVNHYLKVIKSIINLSIKEDEYTYVKHPFNSFTFTKEKILKNVLTENEIEILMNKEIDNEKLNLIRNMFLFQIFSNGMRVSDLLLLKWKNLSSTRLVYTMFKTNNPIDIPININMSLLLSKNINCYNNYVKLTNEYSIPFVNEYTINPIKQSSVNLRELDHILEMYFSEVNLPPLKKSGLKMLNIIKNINGGIIDYKGYKVGVNDDKIKRVIDTRETLLKDIDRIFIISLNGRINKLKNIQEDFVFPVLSKDLFKNTKINKLSLEQYKNIKHNTIVYNRRLKKIQEICKIETPLTSHVSRHTFTNLLLRMDNVNLYDISQSLGHTSLKTTESYLTSGFNTEKIDYLSIGLSEKFNRK